MNVLIIFETQNGTTQYVAEVMQKELSLLGHNVDLHSVKAKGADPSLEKYGAILFGAPTYEDGKLETAMKVFTVRFSKDLSQYKIGVFGLGNSTFPQFCFSAMILEEFVHKNHGELCVPLLKIDGFPDDLTHIESWIKQLSEKIL